jgi:hypothetical protein
MIQTKNDPDRFTAERVLRTRPKTYRACLAAGWGAKESRRIHEILRLFIGDAPACASIDDDAINHT